MLTDSQIREMLARAQTLAPDAPILDLTEAYAHLVLGVEPCFPSMRKYFCGEFLAHYRAAYPELKVPDRD